MVQLTISGEGQKPPLIEVSLYHGLTGCEPPTSIIFVAYKNSKWRATASKGLIGSTNNQWGRAKIPLIEVSLYHGLTGCKPLGHGWSCRNLRRWSPLN
ncbi:hypothetical protein DX933_05235 [Ornithinibacillus gellani]|nr:hypothetical protein DX933_05235 [Ornithinibacillus gellani]